MSKFHNKFYKKKVFNLIKVTFTGSDSEYTYAAHVSDEVKTGDYVVVPVGNNENIFQADQAQGSISVVKVTDVTDDMRHLPKDYELKHIIQKISPTKYNKILKHKRKSK